MIDLKIFPKIICHGNQSLSNKFVLNNNLFTYHSIALFRVACNQFIGRDIDAFVPRMSNISVVMGINNFVESGI